MAGQCFGSDGAPPQVVWFLILLLCLLQYEYDYDVNGDRVVLGKGTYGIVFAGRDLSNQVRIAIKEIPRETAGKSAWAFLVLRCHLHTQPPVPSTDGTADLKMKVLCHPKMVEQ